MKLLAAKIVTMCTHINESASEVKQAYQKMQENVKQAHAATIRRMWTAIVEWEKYSMKKRS